MAAFWMLSIPAGLWATRALSSSVESAFLSQGQAEPPNLSLDFEGALASAEASLLIRPLSPTANHLRTLVSKSAEKLRNIVDNMNKRIHKRSWSRLLRNPDFSKENEILAREIDTLKSRVQLFLNVVMIFPSGLNADTNDNADTTFAQLLTSKEELSESDEDKFSENEKDVK